MANKILRSILLAVIPILLLSLIVVTGVLCHHYDITNQKQLREQLFLAAQGTKHAGKEYLSGLSLSNTRLTWISPSGVVLFDNTADAMNMENHRNRHEVCQALETGSGSSRRYSSTLTEQTIYEAILLDDGSVLRISVSRATAFSLVLGLLQPIALILLAAMVLSVFLAHRMAKYVTEPLNQLDLDHPLDNQTYEELSPLLYRIHCQRQEILQQIDQLRQQHTEFEQITGNMNEALILLDPTGRIVSINPAAKKLFSTDDTCIGSDLLCVYRKEHMQLALAQALQSERSAFRASIQGHEYQIDVNRIDDKGVTKGIAILSYDITEQINAERNRREFTANVSHELKTPLQSIIGSTDLLQNNLVKSEDIPRFISRIHNDASRLVMLIEDIIRLSQLDEGCDLPMENVSLLSLSQDVCSALSDSAEGKGVSISVSGVPDSVRGVRHLLFEMIYNLCDNAIRYNDKGGWVKISISNTKQEICLQVADSGIGIAPEHQEKVFQRFYRVDKSHSRQTGGTGLGLSIVKRAVQLHHGRIEIDSAPGKGTTIAVFFSNP